MGKIKILFGITCILVFIYLLHFGSYIVLADFYSGIAEATENELVFGKYNFVISFVQSLGVFTGLLTSLKCLYTIIKEGFFTATSKKLMNWAGLIFLFSGVVMCILDIVRFAHGGDEVAIIGIIMLDFMFTLFGFVVLIVADMAQTGYQLKSENDLTI